MGLHTLPECIGLRDTIARTGRVPVQIDYAQHDMYAPATITKAVTTWFQADARDLPWRDAPGGQRDPYHSLVSEFMLQQTQVARVLEHFDPFIERFPTPTHLANAPEEAVMSAWSGLGYYRRARSLHAAARMIRDEHNGVVPEHTDQLLALPGVGRYTAGAIASIVFGRTVPIVDGNVVRVLARLDGIAGPPDHDRTWERATELVEAATSPGSFNEGLMELGATICTPRNPKCNACPLARLCAAKKDALQGEIPQPKPATKRRVLFASSVVAIDVRGRILAEQRPKRGLWAGLWQVPTLERDDKAATKTALRHHVNADAIDRISAFKFETTHRTVQFAVYQAKGVRARDGREWLSKRALAKRGISNAMRRVLTEAGMELPDAIRLPA